MAVCVFVSGSPAVECCADVATRNEGLELNLEGEEEEQEEEVIRGQRGDRRESTTVYDEDKGEDGKMWGIWEKCDKVKEQTEGGEMRGWRDEKRETRPRGGMLWGFCFFLLIWLQIHRFLCLPLQQKPRLKQLKSHIHE